MRGERKVGIGSMGPPPRRSFPTLAIAHHPTGLLHAGIVTTIPFTRALQTRGRMAVLSKVDT